MTDPNSQYNQEHKDLHPGDGLDKTVNHAEDGMAKPNKAKWQAVGPNGTEDHSDDRKRRNVRWKTDDLILGRYRVLSEIGQGGMGVVYHCLDTIDQLGRTEVAVKALPPEVSHNPAEMNDMWENYGLVSGLIHENIAACKTLEKDNLTGDYYLVMEYVEGEDLRSWIKEKRRNGSMTLYTALPVLRQIATALDAAHKRRIMHRDVKPDNVRIKRDGTVKVLDFGLAAQIRSSLTRVSREYSPRAGTNLYKAPEQWRGQPQGEATDQYALAVTAYEMLAGHVPFEDSDVDVLKKAVLEDEVVPIVGLPPYANEALKAGLAKEPTERYKSCLDFVRALGGEKIERKTEHVFDENKFYVLWGQVEEYREEYGKTEWDRGQTFGSHLESFMTAWRAASAASKFQNLPKAYEFLLKTESEWEWLQRNTPLRAEAAKKRVAVQEQQKRAEDSQAQSYAKDEWCEALHCQEEAAKKFEAGEFEAATESFTAACSLFEKAGQDALAEHLRQVEEAFSNALAQKDFQACGKAVDEMASLNAVRAEELAAAMQTTRVEAISELKLAIEKSAEQRDWAGAYDHVKTLTEIEPEDGRECKEDVDKEKEKYCKGLEQNISEFLDGKRFKEAAKVAQALMAADWMNAQFYEDKVRQEKEDYVNQRGQDILSDLDSGRYETAHDKVLELKDIDEAEWKKWEDTIRVHELEQGISDAIAGYHFDEAERITVELSGLDEGKGWLKQEAVVAAKNKRAGQLKEMITADMGQGNYASAYEKVRELATINKEEEVLWEKRIRVQEFVKSVAGAVAEKRFDKADTAVRELETLDVDAARQQAEVVQAAKNAYMDELEKLVGKAAEEGRFDGCGSAIDEIGQLDKERAQKCKETVESAKAAAIARLEVSTSEAIERGDYALAHATASELSALDCEKGRLQEDIIRVHELEKEIAEAVAKNDFAEAMRGAEELTRLNAEKSRDWVERIQAGKEERVKELSEKISAALASLSSRSLADLSSSMSWTDVDSPLEELKTLDMEAAQRCKEAIQSAIDDIQSAKVKEVLQLQRRVDEALADRDFAEAETVMAELEKMDWFHEAAAWKKKIAEEKEKYCRQLEGKIDVCLEQARFEEVEECIEKLAPLDEKKAGRLKDAMRLRKLEYSFDEALGEKRFADAEGRQREMTALDSAKAEQMGRRLAGARADYAIRQEREIVKMIEQGHLTEAEAMLGTLEAFDGEKARKIGKRLGKAKQDAIRSLEKDIKRAIGAGAIDAAESAVGKLAALDSEKGRIWQEAVEAVKSGKSASAFDNQNRRKMVAVAAVVALIAIVLCVMGYRRHLTAIHREAATTARISAIQERSNAENEQAGQYAADALQKAIDTLVNAQKEFENGRFVEAEDGFSDAEKAFAAAGKAAREEHVRQIAGNIDDAIRNGDFSLAGTELEKLKALHESKATELAGTLAESKAKQAAEQAKLSAEQAKSKAEKQQAVQYAFEGHQKAMELFANAQKEFENSRWKKAKTMFGEAEKAFDTVAKTAFEEHVRQVKNGIKVAIDQKLFEKAEAGIGELRRLDVGKVQAWQKNLDVARLEDRIADDIKQTHFEDARTAIEKLRLLDADKALAWQKKLDAAQKEEQIARLLDEARMACNARRWQKALDKADDVLKLDAANQEAGEIKRTATEEIKPKAEIIAVVNGEPVAASLEYKGKTYTTPWTIQPLMAGEKLTGKMTCRHGGAKYSGDLDEVVDWTGLKQITVRMEEIPFNGIVTLPGGVELKLVKIEHGSFMMGSGMYSDETPHTVTLTKDYWLGETEVTQGQYTAVMGNNPSSFQKGDDYPVEGVSWNDAIAFCRKLNELFAESLPEGYRFNLPSEAQWEYACRAGTATAWYYGDSLSSSQANFDGNYPGGGAAKGKYLEMATPVRSYSPNAWGLYDMHGNVWEWCRDVYEAGYAEDPEFLKGQPSADDRLRVSRGGSWYDSAVYCRSALRRRSDPAGGNYFVGFRVALVTVDSTTSAAMTAPASADTAVAVEHETTTVAATPTSQEVQSSVESEKKTITLPGGVELKLVKVEKGSFQMGSEEGTRYEKPVHRVTLTKDFWMGQYEVTQEQYKAVMGENPSYFKYEKGDCPVECASWEDAMSFCRKLTEQERNAGRLPAGYEYTLPTEAQWEFAARGGNQSKGYKYSGGNDIETVAWYDKNSGGKAHPVGTKRANELGLYDMSGNVWEWCRDWSWLYPRSDVTDPIDELVIHSDRVLRGGSWLDPARLCHSWYRSSNVPSFRDGNLGFRVALVPVQ